MARLPDLEQAQVPLLKDEAVPDSDDAAIVLGESESWTQRICKSRVAQGVTGLLMAVSLLGLLLYASGWTYPIPVPPVKEPETEPPLFLRNMPDVIVDGTGNKWTGLQDNGLLAFYDIPYADSPVRFRRAQPYSGREFVDVAREAHWYPVGCSTAFMDGGGTDCLKLNIVIPSVQEELLPVMLHIHGGGFINGYASAITPMDMMRRAAEMKKKFIFVAIDYRLGAMGLLAAPLDDGKAPRDLDLNVAFKDQLLAMEWVYKHIKHFGGDHSRITMIGESAGAMSISLHQLYSPHHLFFGAILLSGGATSFPVLSADDATSRVLKTLNGTRCSSNFATPLDYSIFFGCLRALTEWEVLDEAHHAFDLQVPAHFPWYPVLENSDGWLNERPSTKSARGDYNKIPIISGTSTDEGSMFFSDSMENDDLGIGALMRITYGAPVYEGLEPIMPDFLKLYELGDKSNLQGTSLGFQRATRVFGDLLFQAPNRFTLQQDAPDSPRWGFSHEEMWPWYAPRYGVFHTSDMADWSGLYSNHYPQMTRAIECSTYLTNFLQSGDPNSPNLALWPRYGLTRQLLALRNDQTTLRTDDAHPAAQDFINLHLRELSL